MSSPGSAPIIVDPTCVGAWEPFKLLVELHNTRVISQGIFCVAQVILWDLGHLSYLGIKGKILQFEPQVYSMSLVD